MSVKDFITQSILSKLYSKENEPFLKFKEKPEINQIDNKSVFEIEKYASLNPNIRSLGKHAGKNITNEIMQAINFPSLGCNPKVEPLLSEYISSHLGFGKYSDVSDFFQMSVRFNGRQIEIEHEEQLINIFVNNETGEIFAKHKDRTYLSEDDVTEPTMFLKSSKKPVEFKSGLYLKQHNDGTINVVQSSTNYTSTKENTCTLTNSTNGYIVLGEQDGQLVTTSTTQPTIINHEITDNDAVLWHNIKGFVSKISNQSQILSRSIESDIIFEKGTKIATPEQKPFKNFVVNKHAESFIKTFIESEYAGQPEEAIAEKVEDALCDYVIDENAYAFYNNQLRRNLEQKALSEEGTSLVSQGQYGILTRALFNPTYTKKAVVEKQMTPLVKNLCEGYQTGTGTSISNIVVTSFGNEQCATFKSNEKDNVSIITGEYEETAFDNLNQNYKDTKKTYNAKMINHSLEELLSNNTSSTVIYSPSKTVSAEINITSWFKTKHNTPTYIANTSETRIVKNEDYQYTSDYLNEESGAKEFYLENEEITKTLDITGRILARNNLSYNEVDKAKYNITAQDEDLLIFVIDKVPTQDTTQNDAPSMS